MPFGFLALLAAFGTLANSLRSNSASVLIRTLLRCSARPNGGGYHTARPLRELRPNGSFAALTSRGLGLPHSSTLTPHKARHAVPLHLTPSFLTPHFSQGHGTPCHYTQPPHSSLLRPHSSSPLIPHSYDLTPHSSLLTPHSYDLTPHSSLLAPHSSLLLTPHSSLLTPHSSLLTPHSSLLPPHSSFRNRGFPVISYGPVRRRRLASKTIHSHP